MKTCKTLEEVRRIKYECSLERLSRTLDEDRQHLEDVMKRAEIAMERKFTYVNNPKPRAIAEEELAPAST